MSSENMRLVEIIVQTKKIQQKILDMLANKELDYVISGHTQDSEGTAVISLPLPADSVEAFRERLKKLDTADNMYTIVVNTEAVASGGASQSQNTPNQVDFGDEGSSHSELHSNVADLTPPFTFYSLMVAMSTIVATIGVLLNSVVVLIGSMILAPLIGPPMEASVATVCDDKELFIHGIKYQLLSGIVGGLSSVGLAVFVRETSFVSSDLNIGLLLEISSYTAPVFLLLVLAFTAGAASALSLSTTGTIGLLGVVIAVGIVPPFGVLGVSLAWGRPLIALGSTTLILLNFLSINLAGIFTFWCLGYRPKNSSAPWIIRNTVVIRIIVLAIAVVLLAIFLAHIPDNNTKNSLVLMEWILREIRHIFQSIGL
jgi:uncharacterized hydrophobic protein (TIGR00341 family)